MSNIDTHLASLISSLKQGDLVPVPPEPTGEAEIMANWHGDADKPLVSIVCHTYNHAAFIEDALNGFLMQRTNFPFEIVVHDDASTDGTSDILRDYQSRYPNLIRLLIQEKNQYKKGRRPPAFSFPMARGKYIAFCEGDDYWIDENKIFKQASFLEANPDVSLVYADSISFSDKRYYGKDFGGAKVDLTRGELIEAPPIFTLTTCFRNVLGVPPELNCVGYGDLFMWSRLGKFGSGKYMPDVLPSFYRVHGNGLHSSSSNEKRLSMLLQTYVAINSYYERIGDIEAAHYFLKKASVVAFDMNGVSIRLIPAMTAMTTAIRKIKNYLR